MHLLGRSINNRKELLKGESRKLVNMVIDYTYALDPLDSYESATEHRGEFLYHLRYSDGTLVALTLMIAESRTVTKNY